MSAPVFVLPELGGAAPAPGQTITLDGPEGRHAAIVQRRGPWERIDVTDGRGLRAECTVTEVVDQSLRLRVEAVTTEPAPRPVLTLVQALAKGDRDEQAIEAAVECGVDAVIPWQADRSIVQWRGPRAAKAHAKWVSTVLAATKQARRAWLPSVAEMVTSKGLVALTKQVTGDDGAVLVLHEAADVPLADAMLPETGELLIVVGPEGGISEPETAALEAAGAQVARLGPHVMRTSTAGPVAVALLSERLGRWAQLR